MITLDGGGAAAGCAAADSVMPLMRRKSDHDDIRRQQEADRQTKALAALALIIALALVALFVVQHLRREGQIEDCLLAGRANCDALIDR